MFWGSDGNRKPFWCWLEVTSVVILSLLPVKLSLSLDQVSKACNEDLPPLWIICFIAQLPTSEKVDLKAAAEHLNSKCVTVTPCICIIYIIYYTYILYIIAKSNLAVLLYDSHVHICRLHVDQLFTRLNKPMPLSIFSQDLCWLSSLFLQWTWKPESWTPDSKLLCLWFYINKVSNSGTEMLYM